VKGVPDCAVATIDGRITARKVLGAVTVGYLLWSLLPLAHVIVFSFNSSVIATRWEGLTLEWWVPWSRASIFRNHAIAVTVRHTLVLASASAAIALLLGTSLALGIRHLSRRVSFTIYALLVLAIAFPPVAFADALWIVFIVPFRSFPFGDLGWFGTKAQVAALAAHDLPIVVLIIAARLAFIPLEQEAIAMDLGAPPTGVLGRVLLPQLWPAIGAAALVAFTISAGDFVITDALRSTDATRSLASSFFGGDPTPRTYALASAVALAGLSASIVVYAVLRVGAGVRQRSSEPNTAA